MYRSEAWHFINTTRQKIDAVLRASAKSVMDRDEDNLLEHSKEARSKNGTNNINDKKKNENVWAYNKKKRTGVQHQAR